MKQTIHVDHSPTLAYDISIANDATTVALTITKQDPDFTAWLQGAPFTKGPMQVRSGLTVWLSSKQIALCRSFSNNGCGMIARLRCNYAYEYINDVRVSIAMAIAAFKAMKQITHVDHSPTFAYDISIDDANTVSLAITKQDPTFTAWLQNAPFTKGPLHVKSVSAVSLCFDEIFLCCSSSNNDRGTINSTTYTNACEYVTKVNVSITMAIAAFLNTVPR